jgi:hypothetical protein
MDGEVNGWVDGWTDGWVDGWAGWWMNESALDMRASLSLYALDTVLSTGKTIMRKADISPFPWW